MTTTILVIDDSADDQHLYRRIFKDFDDVSLVMASSAAEGFAHIADASPDPNRPVLSPSKRPDLILLDYNLPDMDGLSFMKRLDKYSDTFIRIPIIMLTGESNTAVAVEAMKNGVDDYLVKDTEGQYLKLLPGVVVHVMAAHAQREHAKLLRKETEALLLRNQTLMQNSLDGIHVIDMHGNVVEANNAFCHMLGYTREEITRLNVTDWDTQWSDDELQERFKDHLVKNARFETVHRRKDGSLIDVEVSTTGVKIKEQYLIFATSHDITKRKNVDKAILESEANLRAMLDNSPYQTWLKDAESRYILINKVYAKFLRLEDASQAIGKTDLDLQPRALAEKYRADDAEVIATRKQKHVEESAFDGMTTHWVETFKAPIIDEHDHVLGTVGFARDVTKRKEAEEALRVAAVTFETRDAIVITDPDANIIRVNRAFTDLTGYSPEEVLGKNPRMMSSRAHDRAFYVAMWQQLLHTGTWSGEIWDKRKNGEVYPKWMTITAIKNERQENIQYIAISSDITARVKAEEELLRESDERFRGTLEQAAVGIAHAALDGAYKQINKKFCEIIGYSSTELIQLGVEEITFHEDLDKDSVLVQQLLAGEISTYIVEKRYLRKNQTRVWVNLTVSLLHNSDGSPKYFIYVIEDITERKRTELELRESRQVLRDLAAQSEALLEKERKHIAREIHDELGQILTALRMDVALLRIQFGGQDEVLLEKTQSMSALLDQAILGVRNVATNLRPTVLDMGIVVAIAWLRDEFVKHTCVPCVAHLSEACNGLDERLSMIVFRIVQESLTNVARHADASRVTISMSCDADMLHVTVYDNGKGFDIANIENRKSFGLLGMNERAIAMGGSVEIVSTPQQGTTVSALLPIKPDGDI